MYTIKQAAARSGLSIPTLRAWERRYGVVHPERTPSGYRLYGEGAIERLVAMRNLVEHEGMQPSQAAEQIMSAGEESGRLIDKTSRPVEATIASHAGSPTTGRAATQADAFVSAARRLDIPAMDRILDDALASERFESAVEHVVFPALRDLGDGWVEGSIDVAMEHAASETIRRRLARFYDGVAPEGPPDVVIGLPPGGHHELGTLAFAIAAQRRGVGVLYLGADVPLASWLTAMDTSLAPVALVGVVTVADCVSASEVVATLGTALRPPVAVLGGPRAHDVVAKGAVVLPGSIDEAVGAMRRLIEGASR